MAEVGRKAKRCGWLWLAALALLQAVLAKIDLGFSCARDLEISFNDCEKRG